MWLSATLSDNNMLRIWPEFHMIRINGAISVQNIHDMADKSASFCAKNRLNSVPKYTILFQRLRDHPRSSSQSFIHDEGRSKVTY